MPRTPSQRQTWPQARRRRPRAPAAPRPHVTRSAAAAGSESVTRAGSDSEPLSRPSDGRRRPVTGPRRHGAGTVTQGGRAVTVPACDSAGPSPSGRIRRSDGGDSVPLRTASRSLSLGNRVQVAARLGVRLRLPGPPGRQGSKGCQQGRPGPGAGPGRVAESADCGLARPGGSQGPLAARVIMGSIRSLGTSLAGGPPADVNRECAQCKWPG